jgi:urea transport system substrate-binding protein
VVSDRLVSLRPTPAQSVLPVVDRLCQGERGKKRLYLIGSDSLYPRAAFEMLRRHLAQRWPKVDIVGETYLPESQGLTRKAVDAMRRGEQVPDAILCLLTDDATLDLLREVAEADFRPQNTPVVMLRAGVKLLRELSHAPAAGQYLVTGIFPGLPEASHSQLIKRWRDKYGDATTQDDLAVAAYVGVRLWAKAVALAGNEKPSAVREAMAGLSEEGPAGPLFIVRDNGYSRSVVRLVRVAPGGTLRVEHTWPATGAPEPYYGAPPKEWEFYRDYWSRNWSERGGARLWFNSGTKRILPTIPDEAGGWGP